MDNYWQQNRLSNYYRAMANAEAKELSRVANSASLMHLKDGFLRMQFQDEISLFIREQLNKLSYAKTEDEFQACLNDIKLEKEYLIQQDRMLATGEARIHASGHISNKNGLFEILINGLAVVAGTMQTIVGAGVIIGSSYLKIPHGVLFGGLLVLHGTNDVYEGLVNLSSGKNDAEGWAKHAYKKGAIYLGFDESLGELAYHAIGMSLSFYGMVRLVLKPTVWRLFYYMPSDYVRGIKKMSVGDLVLESTFGALSVYNISSSAKKLTDKQEQEGAQSQSHRDH